MRRCANCDEWITHDSATCIHCGYADSLWQEHLVSVEKYTGSSRAPRLPLIIDQIAMQTNSFPGVFAHKITSRPSYRIPLSPFSDSQELGFHLGQIEEWLADNGSQYVQVVLDASCWEYSWEYGSDYDQERDQFLPPNLPLLGLVEVARFLRVLDKPRYNKAKVDLVLPPRRHAAARFLTQSGLFSGLQRVSIRHIDRVGSASRLPPACDDVLVPLTSVGPETKGQLSSEFHQRFDNLAVAGRIRAEFRSPLRLVIGEAAENADTWGGGRGWVACFLRQESRGTRRFGHQDAAFNPTRETHLLLHVISVGPSLAASLDLESEQDATDAVMIGFSTQPGGGNGMPAILRTITRSAAGTVYLSTGDYTRIISPDGMIREYRSAGSPYLPGVHLCGIVPLAVVSDWQSLKQAA